MQCANINILDNTFFRTKYPELVDSESDTGQREKIMGIIAGMISAGMSFG